MENTGGLNFESFDPAHELSVTKSFIADGATGGPAPADTAPGAEIPASGEKVATDYKGRTFDPDIHMTDENGKPLIQNKNIRIKKGLKQKIKDVFTGGEKEKADFTEEKSSLPQSDHERDKEVQENLRQAETQAAASMEMDIHSDDASTATWLVLAGVLGPEAYNQYDKLNPKVKKHFEIFEKRTGKSVDLPPGVGLALGLAGIGLQIVHDEPECQKRYLAVKSSVTENLGGYVKGVFGKDPAPAAEEIEEEEKRTDD